MKIKRVSIEISVDQLQETDSRTPKLLHKSGPAFAKSHTDCKFFTRIQLLQYDIIGAWNIIGASRSDPHTSEPYTSELNC